MVKVQKPNPKTMKKVVPEQKKTIQKKSPKVNPPKEKVKEIVKAVKNVAKSKITKDVKPKEEAKKITQKEQKPVQKKLPVAKKNETKTQNVANAEKKPQAKPVKEAKATKALIPIYEPGSFNEEQFQNILKLENIKKISKALKELVEKEVSEKKTSIFSDYKYFLNIASYKIPTCPKRLVKLNLKHSLVDPNTDDVVIIVSDLQRGAKVDYERTVQHYEDLLREAGVDNIKVVPFNQLRNECTTFEAKRKFANTYDYFLCDGRIVGHATGFCGKFHQKPRTTLHAVRLNNSDTYKSDIEHALNRTSYRQLQKGDMISIAVGNDRFTTNQLADNIHLVIEQLKTIFPGGYPNIRNMYIKIDIKGTSSLPLYVNLVGAPQETPNVVGPREQRMIKLKKQANEILTKFSMGKTGEFVKLNKDQVKRKQQIRDARTALLSNDKHEIEEDNDESESQPPSKKAKNTKQIKKVVETVDENDDEDDDNDDEDDDNDEDDDEANEEVSDVSDEEEDEDED